MLATRDLLILKGPSKPVHGLCVALFLALSTLQLFLVYNNVSLAIGYGSAMGLDFRETLSLWNSEPDLQKLYLGLEVQSIHRLNLAIQNFGIAVLFLILVLSLHASRGRNKRILAALEECGAVSKS